MLPDRCSGYGKDIDHRAALAAIASSAVISGESLTGDSVGHGADGSEASGGCRRGSGGDGFFVLLPGLAQMHMQVDEAGSDDAAPSP